MTLLKKFARFVGLTLAASTCALLCCIAISTCFWLVFHWASGEALARQQGLGGLQISYDALPYALIADGAGLGIVAMFVVGGPALTFAFAGLIEGYAKHRAARAA